MPKDDPLCFILMPFGKKKDPGGGPDIDFDAVYNLAIGPAIEDAGMQPIRADEEIVGGIIHKPMFERLLLCDYAVADLTTANANVFYELGVRHAARPATTVSVFANKQQIPFDIKYLRSLPYDLSESNALTDEQAAVLRKLLGKRLIDLRDAAQKGPVPDSPIFQLVEGYLAPDIKHLKTDVFRERAEYAAAIKKELSSAREAKDIERVVAVENRMGKPDQVEAGVFVDLFLTYRALSQWDRMIALFDKMPVALQHTVMMREQFGFALNRAKRRTEAVEVLEKVLEEQGPSSETYGLLGRVYKDLWSDALKAGEIIKAKGYLNKAIDYYVRGFDADSRDAYPGVNAVTLLDIRGDEASLKKEQELLPVVRYAVLRKMKGSKPDYWDHATLLELAVLANDFDAAETHLSDALANVREQWEPETTANNLTLIRDARQARGAAQDRLDEILSALTGTAPN